MLSPMVETVRMVPLIIERETCFPMETDDTGFPFERNTESSGEDSFRTQLDDIAKRHPEFAEHLEGFPFRSRTGSSGPRNQRDESEFGRRFGERPFNSRFEHFGYPFNRSEFFDEPETYRTTQQQQQHNEQPSHLYQQQQRQQTEQEQHKPVSEEKYTVPSQQQQSESTSNLEGQEAVILTDKQKIDGRKNLQQSNTVDLGQKQEAEIVNERNQRSMSAPPDNRQPRYISSINIPIQRSGGMEMGQSQNHSQQQNKQEQQHQKPFERVIPIHVEGRDEPILPRNQTFNTTSHHQNQQPQPERMFGGGQQQSNQHHPHVERIFGHRPSHFTQYGNKSTTNQYPTQQDDLLKQQQQYQQQQQQKYQQQQEKQEEQQQEQPTKPIQQQQQQQNINNNNPIDMIKLIQKDVNDLMLQVEQFDGKTKNKKYLYLDEMLTRNLLKLDNIDTQGQENIRQARKEAIKCIESCIGVLEAKANSGINIQTTETDENKNDKMDIVVNEEKKLVEKQEENTNKNEDEMVQEMTENNSKNENNELKSDVVNKLEEMVVDSNLVNKDVKQEENVDVAVVNNEILNKTDQNQENLDKKEELQTTEKK